MAARGWGEMERREGLGVYPFCKVGEGAGEGEGGGNGEDAPKNVVGKEREAVPAM